jgi:predicted metal-dependent peptidase
MQLSTSFDTIREDATLAEAKMKMDPTSKIQDVFVTKGGTRNEPIIGLITNNKIQEVAIV